MPLLLLSLATKTRTRKRHRSEEIDDGFSSVPLGHIERSKSVS
jgi:hypothetical protein